MSVTRTFDLLDRYKTKFSDKTDIFTGMENGAWRKYGVAEVIELTNKFSYGLLKLGIQPGDKIATVSNNRPEWNFADHGMLQIGAVHVPVYPTISEEEYLHILEHSEAKFVIVSTKELYDKIQPLTQKIANRPPVYTFDTVSGAKHWSEILELGTKSEDVMLRGTLKNRRDAVSPDDVCTIIYTSGTTGVPKGVMLTHTNFIYQVKYIEKIIGLNHKHRALSFLPLCHVLERIGGYTFQYLGMSIWYAESIEKVADNLKEVKPNVFVTVPRLLERIYDKIIEKGKDLEGIKRELFHNSAELGLKFSEHNSLIYNAKRAFYDKLIFKKWRAALGGSVKLIICGGAALQPRLARAFMAAGLPVFEGYGLTETAPVIAVNHPKDFRFGTVGPILGKEQQVKIADDGEILFKGPNLMPGYFKAPELTAESIDAEGWLHTGDIGEMILGKYLKITDRKKEMFKLSTGKYVAPQAVENILKESLFIEQAMVVGENEKYTAAVLVPNFEFLHDWASRKHIHFHDNEELIKNTLVVERFQEELDEYNKRLGKTEQIKKFELVAENWTVDTGELSPTLKLKRRFVKQKYQTKLGNLFNKF